MTPLPSFDLPLLAGYPEPLRAQARQALADGSAATALARRYPEPNPWRSDGALYERASELKARHLRHAPPLARVAFDNRLAIDQRALGTLTSVSRVQGNRLQAKREIRVAAFFKDLPAAMVEMILVHELAHLKEREHDKAFYALCSHMLGDYHQVEFDTRLMLTLRSVTIG